MLVFETTLANHIEGYISRIRLTGKFKRNLKQFKDTVNNIKAGIIAYEGDHSLLNMNSRAVSYTIIEYERVITELSCFIAKTEFNRTLTRLLK